MLKNKNKIVRRDFIKILGGTTAVALTGCGSAQESKSNSSNEVPTDKMVLTDISTTGDKISLLGYGCMRWPLLPSPAPDGNVVDQEAVNKLVDYAIEHGVNYFDTSPVYLQGWSERVMGVALEKYPRDKYFIATKLSNFSKTTWDRESSLQIYKNSFEYLKVDYIDYMLLHSVGNGGMETFKQRYLDNGILDFLIEERAAGRIKNLGFSFHGDIEVYDYLLSRHDEIKWDFVQIQVNYVDWKYGNQLNAMNADGEYLYNELFKRDIPSIIMEPLLGGRLANLPEHLKVMLNEQEPEKSIASWAFRYAGSFPKVLTVLSGMTYLDHLQDNIKTYSPLVPITKEEDELLADVAKLYVAENTIACNDCKYCMPCPFGIDIPAILLHYNKCIIEDNIPADKMDEKYAKQRRAFLVGYDRSVPKLRQADLCIGCKECNIHCPQNIDIPKEIHKISAFVDNLKREGAL